MQRDLLNVPLDTAASAPAILWATDPDGSCAFLSQAWYDYTGRTESASPDEGGFEWLTAIHPDDREEAARLFREANAAQQPLRLDYRLRRHDGEYRWMIDSGTPRHDASGRFVGFIGTVIDVHERKLAEEFRSVQARILEMITSEESIEDILVELVSFIELQIPDSIGSILLLDPDGRRLRHGAAPRLPDAYNAAIDGFEIGPSAGSCGTAAYRGERVIVEDIQSDPLWRDVKQLAAEYGLRACWSEPIRSSTGERLGTTAIYFTAPRSPYPDELAILEATARFAGIAIERPRAQLALRESEARFRAFTSATSDAIYSMSPDWTEIRQFQAREFIPPPVEPSRSWLDEYIHPDDQGRVKEAIAEAIAGKSTFELEHRVIRADGSPGWTYSRAIPILNDEGDIVEWFGAASDVTARKEADELLRRNAETFTKLVEQSPLGIYTVDSGFRIANISKGAEPAFRNVHPLIGRDFAEVMHILWPEPFAGEVIRLFRHTLETGEPYVSPGLTEKRRDTGSIESYEWQINRVTLADGKDGVVCYYFDATRLHQAAEALRESEERFRMLADNIAQLAWTCDEELGKVNWYNRRWLEYTGRTFEQMRDWGWTAVHHPEHVERVKQSVNHARASGEIWEDTFPLLGADGNYRWFLSRAVPIRDEAGKIVRWFGTNTDVTKQREAEEALRRADRRKDEFLATLAHELRNPLAPIRTGLELLKVEEDPEVLSEIRTTMERQTQQLITLVNDLLDVSRITQGKLELRKCRVELANVLESAVEASKPLIDEAGHQLTLDLTPEQVAIHADPNRLAQVISNLLNNSVKYTPEGGSISLRTSLQGNEVVIAVKDDGIGIPKEMMQRVFEMFAQIERPIEKAYTGLGIGLTLVKSLVEMHGGRIEGYSDGEGRGSEFCVRLPVLVESSTSSSPAREEAPAKANRLRVLIVDDNRAAADMLAMVVKMLGNEVRTAYDGAQGVEAAGEFLPEVVLMDLGMPTMNGYEAARQIRQHDWGKSMVLVALTGWGQQEDRQRTKEAGFDRHLVKPAEPADLREVFAAVAGA